MKTVEYTPGPLYLSRPDIVHPHLEINQHSALDEDDSFLFVAVFSHFPKLKDQTGPLIFDRRGNLIWCGAYESGAGGADSILNFEPCSWQGNASLCLFRGQKRLSVGYGQGVVLNQHYEEIAVFNAANGAVDQHECHTTIAGDTVLFTTYRPRPHDLGFVDGVGWIEDPGFQEINVTDGRRSLVFAWTASEHVDVSQSTIPVGRHTNVFGSGRSHQDGFDWFHINSVDKLESGDYLVSARHLDAVLLVSGQDGSVLWQLGGQHSSFTGSGASFRRQHDVRQTFVNATHSRITMFNNEADGYIVIGNLSEGLEILLNHQTMVATVERHFVPKMNEQPLLSLGMGSLQIRHDTQEAVLCSGSNATVTIFDDSGQVKSQASFDDRFDLYRAFVKPWIGNPVRPPDLWAYSRTPTSPLHIYASWNGKTGVSSWQFYIANASQPYQHVGSVDKTGFETSFTCDACVGQRVIAEAVTADGSRRNSTEAIVFVPPQRLASTCRAKHCFVPSNNMTHGHGMTSSLVHHRPAPHESSLRASACSADTMWLRFDSSFTRAALAGLAAGLLLLLVSRRFWTPRSVHNVALG